MIVNEINKPLKDYLHFDTPTKEQIDALMKLEEFVKPDNESDFFCVVGCCRNRKNLIDIGSDPVFEPK